MTDPYRSRSPYGGNDPSTPVGAEVALQAFSDALDEARLALEKARKTELSAKYVRDSAKRRATLSADCPKVGAVIEGARITVAYRDAWVDEQVEGEQLAYDLAVTARQAASEHLRTLREQGIIQQSITKSIAQQFQMGGGSGGDRR